MIDIDFRVLRTVFNQEKVARRMRSATFRALKRAGSMVRQTARQSMKSGGGYSKPGRPPKRRDGQIHKFLYFVVDQDRQSVIVGPVKLPGAADATAVLEQGGNTDRKVWTGRPGKRRRVKVRADYEPRPFMGPALEKEQDKLPELWRGAFK